MPHLPRALRLVPFLPALAACDLEDTVVAPVSPGIVVHAVMRPDQSQQYVLVEQLFDGVVPPQQNIQPSPPGPLQTPVKGAAVTVANLDLPGDSCGASVAFDTLPIGVPPGFGVPGSYWSRPGCPTMRPGDRLALRVDVPGLGTVTGVTRVPGLDAATLTVGGRAGAPGDTLQLNRDREDLAFAVQARYQRAVEIVSYRSGTIPPGAAEYLETPTLSLVLFADSTPVTVPGTVRHLFSRATAEEAFRGGRLYDLALAVADSNYYDYVRSANHEITGRGFINRLQGGIGIFGSVVAAPFAVRAVAEIDDPREGTYGLAGTIDGVAVDVELTAYLAPGQGRDTLSGFLRGTWFFYGVTALGATVTFPRPVDGQSVDGWFAGDSLELVIPTLRDRDVGRDDIIKMRVSGLAAGPSFVAEVTERTVFGTLTVGTVTVTRK